MWLVVALEYDYEYRARWLIYVGALTSVGHSPQAEAQATATRVLEERLDRDENRVRRG